MKSVMRRRDEGRHSAALLVVVLFVVAVAFNVVVVTKSLVELLEELPVDVVALVEELDAALDVELDVESAEFEVMPVAAVLFTDGALVEESDAAVDAELDVERVEFEVTSVAAVLLDDGALVGSTLLVVSPNPRRSRSSCDCRLIQRKITGEASKSFKSWRLDPKRFFTSSVFRLLMTAGSRLRKVLMSMLMF